MLADQLILVEHEAGVLHNGVARGEVVVPEQRHLFLKGVGRIKHPVQPPGAELAVVIRPADAVRQPGGGAVELRLTEAAGQEVGNDFLRAELQRRF